MIATNIQANTNTGISTSRATHAKKSLNVFHHSANHDQPMKLVSNLSSRSTSCPSTAVSAESSSAIPKFPAETSGNIVVEQRTTERTVSLINQKR